jgi:hypothetical protein
MKRSKLGYLEVLKEVNITRSNDWKLNMINSISENDFVPPSKFFLAPHYSWVLLYFVYIYFLIF